MNNRDIDQKLLNIINNTPLIDFHTHLFPSESEFSLEGVYNLLTYHYLFVEALRRTEKNPKDYFQLN